MTRFLWSTVIAGIGLLALLVRYAAIYRFGTDAFIGNVLFGVIFILLVGLYLGSQFVIDDVVFAYLEDNIREYGSLDERLKAREKYPYFEYYLGDFYHDEASLEVLYEEWYELHPKHIKKELDLGICRVPRIVPEVDGDGCFVRIAREDATSRQRQNEKNPLNGYIMK